MLAGHEYSENDFEYLFILGGDGSFLHYAKEYAFQGKKIIGLREDKESFFPHSFNKLKELDKLTFKPLDLIQINSSLIALNELYISGKPLLNSEIYLNEKHLESYRGTALLFSTQLGSTAHNKSAGGAILFPESNVWTMKEISPQGSQSLRSSLIFPNNYLINLIINKEYGCYIDGVNTPLKGNLNLRLVKSSSQYCLFDSLESYINKLKNILL